MEQPLGSRGREQEDSMIIPPIFEILDAHTRASFPNSRASQSSAAKTAKQSRRLQSTMRRSRSARALRSRLYIRHAILKTAFAGSWKTGWTKSFLLEIPCSLEVGYFGQRKEFPLTIINRVWAILWGYTSRNEYRPEWDPCCPTKWYESLRKHPPSDACKAHTDKSSLVMSTQSRMSSFSQQFWRRSLSWSCSHLPRTINRHKGSLRLVMRRYCNESKSWKSGSWLK